MASFGFGLNCNNCCHGCNFCAPCTCFEFYDPLSCNSTTPENLNYQPYLLFQCPSGQNVAGSYGGGWDTQTVESYTVGTLVCQPSSINNGLTSCSPYQYDTPMCQPSGGHQNDYLQGCSEYSALQTCVGNPSGSNAVLDYLVQPYPQSTIEGVNNLDCFQFYCGCTNDVCNTDQHACIQIPYCPTKLTTTWDAATWQLLIDNAFVSDIPTGWTLVSEACPYDFEHIASFGVCGPENLDNTGSYAEWIPLFTQWYPAEGKYGQAGITPCSNPTIYATNLVFDDQGNLAAPSIWLVPRQCAWDCTLIVEGCVYQEINMCQDNTVRAPLETRGQGGYVGDFFSWCPENCECITQSIPPVWPQGSLSLNVSITRNLTVDGSGPYTVNFNTNLNLPLDKNTGPPGNDGGCGGSDGACYSNTCVGASVSNYPVAVLACTQGVGCFGNGVGTVTLNSASCGFVGYSPTHGVCMNTDGTTIPGALCQSAVINTLGFSPWGCSDILPQNGGIRPRTACFDVGNGFTGWDSGDNCGCGNPPAAGCTWYSASVGTVNFGGVLQCYGTVDLCAGTISVVVYDYNCNGIAGQFCVVGSITIN